jgi:hypothetical protein
VYLICPFLSITMILFPVILNGSSDFTEICKALTASKGSVEYLPFQKFIARL